MDELLASDRSVEEGGVRTSVRGLPCFHIPFLAQTLQLRSAAMHSTACCACIVHRQRIRP